MFLEKRINKWQNDTFPKSDSFSKMKHLKKEIVELEEALDHADPLDEELADCAILLIGIAGKNGINLKRAIRKKFSINKKREWEKPNKDNVYFHKK